MATLTRVEKLLRFSAEDIEDRYRRGRLTAAQRNDLMRERARAELDRAIDDKGVMKTVVERTVHHVQKGWDNLKESIVRDPTNEVKTELYYAGLTVWGGVQILSSIFNAIGEVTGQKAEQWVLRAGASPGIARMVNFATDIGTGFIPIGVVSQSFARTVQYGGKIVKGRQAAKAAEAVKVAKIEHSAEAAKVAKTVQESAEKVAKEAAETAAKVGGEATEKVAKETAEVAKAARELAVEEARKSAEIVAKGGEEGAEAAARSADDLIAAARGITEGLKADGVHDAAKVVKGTAAAAGVNLGNILDDVTEAIAKIPEGTVQRQFADDLLKFQGRMRSITKVQAHEETARMAERMGLSLDDLRDVVPGQALNEKEMLAYLKALEPQIKTMQDLAQDVTRLGTQESIEALAQHTSELFTMTPTIRGAEVTAGRSVEILKSTPPIKRLTDLMAAWDPDAVAAGNFPGAMRTFAEDIITLASDADKSTAMALIAQSNGAKYGWQWWGPRLRAAYINLLLARPVTQVRNFMGNSIASVNAVFERTVAGMFSIDKQNGAHWREGVYMAKGMMHGLTDGAFGAFKDAFKHVDPDDVTRLDFAPFRFGGKLGRIFNSPTDATRGMDNAFKHTLRRGSYYADALHDGAKKGLDDHALAEFVIRRVNNPTMDMIGRADDFVLNGTFQNELGTIGQAIRSVAQTGPLVLWFPFMKTPINLAKYAWNRTPLLQLMSKTLYNDILTGGVAADLAIARLTLASMHGMVLFNLAQEGMLTGSGPVDPGLRRGWLATNQPYSFRTEKGFVPITNVEPETTIIGMVSDFAQVMNQLDEPSVGQASMAITFSLMKNLADKTYWRTVDDIVELSSALIHGHDPTAASIRTILGPLLTVSTGGPLGGTFRRAIDPHSREARSVIDQFINKVPGWSRSLPALRDGYGDPYLPPHTIGGPWLQFFSPLQFRPEETDPIKIAGHNLGVKPPTFPHSVGGNIVDDFDIREPRPGDRFGVELAPKERDRWQQMYRGILHNDKLGIEPQLFQNTQYQKAPPAMKRVHMEGALRSSKKLAFGALLAENPELSKRMLQAETAALTPLLTTPQQTMVERLTQQSSNLIDTLSAQQRRNLLRWGILDEGEPEELAP